MTIVAGIVQVAIAPILHRLRALLPSEIAGLVIAIVGLALAALGMRYMLGISADGSIKTIYLDAVAGKLTGGRRWASCGTCGRIYWRGARSKRLVPIVESAIRAAAVTDRGSDQ